MGGDNAVQAGIGNTKYTYYFNAEKYTYYFQYGEALAVLEKIPYYLYYFSLVVVRLYYCCIIRTAVGLAVDP